MQSPATAEQGFALPAYLDPAAEGFATHTVAACFTPDCDIYALTTQLRGITGGTLRLVNFRLGIWELYPICAIFGNQ
jgi:hypothetical protein